MNDNIFGVDLGTCNLKVYSKSNGKIMKEKNTIAIIDKSRIYAYGDSAYEMYEKTPEAIKVIFPVVSGVIADYNYLQTMVLSFLEDKVNSKLRSSEFVVAVPTDITDVEKRAFYDIFLKNKIRPKNILLCEKPIADAVGLGLDINQPTGILIVDMGADTTEISVISMGGLVLSELLHFGGNRLDENIITHLRNEYNLVIGKKTAKEIKETIGSGMPGRTESMNIVGRDVLTGLPVEMTIHASVAYDAMKKTLESFCTSIKMILEKTPPELAKDIMHSGIYITGGSSLIHNLDKLFESITNIKVNTTDAPDESVVRGLVKIVSDPKLKKLPFTIKK